MSDYMISTQIMAVYGTKAGRPPEVWYSEWTLINGERIGGGDLPDGFTFVEKEQYDDAVRAQAASMDRSTVNQDFAYRQTLSTKRSDLVKAGLTVEQTRILVPDPENDYSIDEV